MNKEEGLIEKVQMYTAEEVCKLLKLSRTTLWRLRERGEVIAVNFGRSVRYPASQFNLD